MTTFREKGAKWKYLIFLQTKLSENFIFYQRRMNSGKIDRGFFSTMTIQSNSTPKSSREHDTPDFRLMIEEENQQRDPTFADFYRMIIAPVADLLDEGEIIIVPESFLFKVPFSALMDENEKYLSETFRIRIVSSLTTLKLIQDCPVDYHSQTGGW